MFSRFFIDRPVFAAVLSIVIVLVGLVSLTRLPIDRYPEITPPTVVVSTRYLGASAEVVERTVATPIEQQLNGVENMLYFESRCTNDGQMVLTATFRVGTDLDIAAVQVQNRVAQAEPQLPEEVIRQGITVRKQSTSLLMVVAITSPGEVYDQLFLSNFAKINVQDSLARVNGVGDVQIAGEREYGMRIWLRPDVLFRLGLTTSDVTAAVRQQNRQAAAGRVGQPPTPPGQEFEFTVNARGRLRQAEEFADIIVTARQDASLVRVKDVGRTELGAFDYSTFGRLGGGVATILPVFQLPGSNALETAEEIRATLQDLASNFPAGVEYQIIYDATRFVEESISEVVKTLFEAVALVILVVFVFLQNWRATLIPLLTIPVSLVGAFLFFPILGFTVNVLTLFGLVLAIGIVVDDAIVVVEAVQEKMEEEGLPAREAAVQAMQELSGAIVAITLILAAVFIPVAFLEGITGRLYRQFSLTIAVAVLISGINALTLSPALCALLLKNEKGRKGWLHWLYGLFNRGFDRTQNAYLRIAGILLRRSFLAAALLVAVLLGIGGLGVVVPAGFLPAEDEGYFLVDITLPPAASLQRTDAVVAEVERILLSLPGVINVVSFGGQSFATGNFGSNVATVIPVLAPWAERGDPALQAEGIIAAAQGRFGELKEAFIQAFNVPPIRGLGNTGGFNLKLQDRSGRSFEELAEAANGLASSAQERPELAAAINIFRPNEPQLLVEVDREQAMTLGVPVNEVYDTLQSYLGGVYVNDFNRFGRTYRVMVQAEPEFRRTPQDVERFFVRTRDGQMMPLNALIKQEPMTGPLAVTHFNLFRSADILGAPMPGYSSGQAITLMEDLARQELPFGYSYEWAGMAYQEKLSSSITAVFLFSLLMVFLFLAAQYENWIIPLSVVLSVPAGVLGAYLALWASGIADDVYTRIGLVLLIGLAAKNAILIVEYARSRHQQGQPVGEAALEASRLRFRPILMTSFAFIMGVLPLVLSSGAGAASRQSLGTAVFGGMLAATLLGVFLIPAFYLWVQKLSNRLSDRRAEAVSPETQRNAS